MKHLKIIALVLLATVITPQFAIAADIPLLNWERGRQQQVVVAEGDLNRNWTVLLEGNGAEKLFFAGSKKDAQGYVVFSVTIPDDFPLGSYSVSATPQGGEKNVIAGVILVEARTRTASSNLVDLTAILVIFTFLTSITSTIRTRKYRYIAFHSSQVLPRLTDPIYEEESNFWDRLEKAPYRLRVQWINSFSSSLLRFVLIRDGELAHRLSKNFYGISPLLGLFAGVIASLEVNKAGGVASTSTALFLVIASLGILDTFAGLTATLGFWAIQIFSGNVTSFRDILISVSLGIAWVGPSLFASLLRESIGRDFVRSRDNGYDPKRLLGVLGSSLVGGLTFYLGQALLESIIYVEHPNLNVSWVHVFIVGAGIGIRHILEAILMEKKDQIAIRDESFTIARVTSPSASLTIWLSIFAFNYMWTRNLSNSFFISVLFAAPFVFSYIRFNGIDKFRIDRYPRNIILEALILAGITYLLFRQISITPVVLEKRVEILLILGGLAPVLHALLSAIYASNEDKFSFERNTEII